MFQETPLIDSAELGSLGSSSNTAHRALMTVFVILRQMRPERDTLPDDDPESPKATGYFDAQRMFESLLGGAGAESRKRYAGGDTTVELKKQLITLREIVHQHVNSIVKDEKLREAFSFAR